MLRNIRPHSLGIVAAAIARPNDSQTTQDTSNNSPASYADNDSDKKAKTSSNEESTIINRNLVTSGSDKEKMTNQSQRTTTCEATCAVQAADAENGFEYGSTAAMFEVTKFNIPTVFHTPAVNRCNTYSPCIHTIMYCNA
jgi:hypothetical protein